MTKTQDLLDKIAAGTHRISNGSVYRFVASRNEWVRFPYFRADTILRAEVALIRAAD